MARTRQEELPKLCGEQWPAVDMQVDKALGLKGWQTPNYLRPQVYAGFVDSPDINVSSYNLARSSDRNALAQVFQRFAFPTAKGAAVASLRVVAHLDSKTLAAIRRSVRVKQVPKGSDRRPTRLLKSDARNLELLSFVVERVIPFAQLLEKRLGKEDTDVRLRPGHRGPKVAVPRDALKEEWNRTHPHDTMSSGNVLMGQFYRAAAKPHLRREFLLRLSQMVDEAWQHHMEHATAPTQGLGHLLAPDSPRPRWRLPLSRGPSWQEMKLDTWWAWKEMKPEEDALQLPELVRRRVEDIIWAASHGDPVRYFRDLPLRVWWSAKPVTLAEQVARQNAVDAEQAVAEPPAKPTRPGRTSRRAR